MISARGQPTVFDGAILAAGPVTGVGRAFLTALRAYAELVDDPLVVLVPDQPDPMDAPDGLDARAASHLDRASDVPHCGDLPSPAGSLDLGSAGGAASSPIARAPAHPARPAASDHCAAGEPDGLAELRAMARAAPHLIVARAPRGAWRRQLLLPRLLRALGARLLHSPVAAIPWRAPCPLIATVHDLPWRARPPLPPGEPGMGWRHRLAVRAALRGAHAVVVPSEATARHLQAAVDARGAPQRPQRPRSQPAVCVIPHGVPLVANPTPPAGRTGPLLVLGDARPRKNLERVRAAHRLAAGRCPDLPPLLLVGPSRGEPVAAAPAGYVSEARKADLLRRCRALLHLSLHEGFGLPVVEAFAHGAPVLAADIDCLREVAAGAALLAPPTDVEAMAAAMVRVHRDGELRQRLFDRGRARAAQLTPAACAAAWRQLHASLTRDETNRRGTASAADHPRDAAAPAGGLAEESVARGA